MARANGIVNMGEFIGPSLQENSKMSILLKVSNEPFVSQVIFNL